MVNSKNKGNAFERKISRELSTWLNPEDPYIFARRSGSGGALRDKQGLTGSGGDIFADKPEGLWLDELVVIELKMYRNLLPDFWGFFSGKGKKIQDFIDQAREAAVPYPGRGWLLIMKCNNYPAIYITNCINFSVVQGHRRVETSQGEVMYMGAYSHLLTSNFNDIKNYKHQTHKETKQ